MMNVLKAIYDVVTNAPAIGLGFVFLIVYMFTDELLKASIVTGIAAVVYFSVTDINFVLLVGTYLLLIVVTYLLVRQFEMTSNKFLAIVYFLGILGICYISYRIDTPDNLAYLFIMIPFLLFVILEKLTESLSFSFIWATRISGIALLVYGINFFINYGTIIMMNIATIILEKGIALI